MVGYRNTIRLYWNHWILQTARNDDGAEFVSGDSTLSINSDFELKQPKEYKWYHRGKWKLSEASENTSSITLVSRHRRFTFAETLLSTIRGTKSQRYMHLHESNSGNTENLTTSVVSSQMAQSSNSTTNELPTSSKFKVLRFGTTFKGLWTLRFKRKRNVSCQDYWQCVNQDSLRVQDPLSVYRTLSTNGCEVERQNRENKT
jgi:hypothetical protein